MKELSRKQAHVWVLPVTAEDEPNIERLMRVLSDGEIERSERFSHARNRREYLSAHILTRLMLSNFADCEPSDWRFVTGQHGRPELAGFPETTNLRFNLSHARGMVACAVAHQDDIGVDVEWMERSNRFTDIAEKKFSQPEFSHFSDAPENEKRHIFFSFWTLKESYIKAIGKGLLEPLDGFAFNLDPLKISFLNDNSNAACWGLDLFQPVPEYLCATSLARPADEEVSITRRVMNMPDLLALASK